MADKGGLVPVYANGSGGGGGFATMPFRIESGTATTIFQGDPVIALTDGSVARMVTVGSTSVIGVLQGIEYTGADGTPVFTNHYDETITGEDIVAHVITDPNQIYMIRVGTTTVNGTLTNEDMFLNYDFVANGGDATTGLSGFILDTGTGLTTVKNARVIGLTNNDTTNDVRGPATKTFTHAYVIIDPRISFWHSTVVTPA
jgi:hypothetical protein